MPMSPPLDAYVTVARCLCHSGDMPMSLWRHAYVTVATCPCHRRHMPMSPSPDAYVTLATCLCHSGDMPMSPPATCLCRQSDIGMSPAPHPRCLVGWRGGRDSALALQVCFPCLPGCLASACRRHIHVGRFFSGRAGLGRPCPQKNPPAVSQQRGEPHKMVVFLI